MITSLNRFANHDPLTRTTRPPKIGIALSGGGARGSAHMGVLRTLEAAGIDYDMMSATSIGALAGLIHCSGYKATEMIDACKRELMPSRLLNKIPGGRYLHLMRLLRKGGISCKIKRYVGEDCRLENLPKRLMITATDLIAGELVVQEQGCAVTALMASMSLPGMARPITGENRLLVDGGVMNNLPGDVLRDRGADIVIGVDISSDAQDERWDSGRNGLLSTLSRSWQLMNGHRQRDERNSCDLVIRPAVGGIGFTAFTEVDRLADAGSAAAEAALPAIQRLLETYQSAHAASESNVRTALVRLSVT